MRGIDLSTYRFDYDLTFCSLLMHADGTIFHVYGGRDHRDAESQLSMSSLIEALQKTVLEHKTHVPKKQKTQARYVEELPPLARKIANKSFKEGQCVHCHSVHDFQREQLREEKRFKRDDVIWIYPDPIQIGVVLKRQSQRVVASVEGDSPAGRAGIAPGDIIVRIGEARILTYGDLSTALHAARPTRHTLAVQVLRGGVAHDLRLELPDRWKHADPRVFAWRPSIWPLTPKPGFGGPRLGPRELERLGLDPAAFAFRVRYLVTWGPAAHTGRAAAKAGIRKGDVVLAVNGKRDFESVSHFHAWVRLTHNSGDVLRIRLRRKGQEQTVDLRLE